jgi:tetratricopeptide (TPR) repeat protein
VQPTQLAVGVVIADRFLLEHEAGHGGMGTVYRARDLRTNSAVAVKLLNYGAGSEDAERFIREAQILGELKHPAIVSYMGHGRTPNGQPFLAMEWLEGEDLSHRMRRQNLSLSDSLLMLQIVADAVAAAHRSGIVHRDIKPSNIYLRDRQIAKATLLDFGIARRMLGAQTMTGTGVVIGTPEYMSPEQARSQHDIGPAADVFSLGCVFFESLTGKPPFAGEHIVAILTKILFEAAPPLRSLRPEMPEAIEILLSRMLHKDPAQRLPNAAAVLECIETLDITAPVSTVAHHLQPLALDLGEQQIVSVIVATPALDLGMLSTLAGSEMASGTRLADIERALATAGVQVESLADGSIVTTLAQGGSITAGDQAAKAARCAILIKEIWAEARIAMATGRGVLRQRLPLGEAIDRAGKLLRSSDPTQRGVAEEGIRIDDVTAGLIDSAFNISRTASGAAVLWGERSSTDAMRPLLGKPTPCVGREQELAILETLWSGCIDESEARAVLVTADPGMGKSRLRHEFIRRLTTRGQDMEVLFGRGDPMSIGSIYGLLSHAIRDLCGVLQGVDLSQRQTQLRARLGRHLAPARIPFVTEFLAELCGMPLSDVDSPDLRAARQNPRLMSECISDAFVEFLRAEVSHHPVLLILEDLHWGDLLTVRLVDEALRGLADQPLFVLALARPEIRETFPKLWPGRSVQEIHLAGLNKRACERLLKQVLGTHLAPQVMARLIEQASGNALYLEELIRAVAEGKGDELPETVLAMLQSRLLRLEPEVRRVLRAASVYGGTFWRGGVAMLLGTESHREDLDRWLKQLISVELIERHRESLVADDVEYGFHHALVREAAYSLLTESDRGLAHRCAAIYLESVGSTDIILLAEHHLRGGDPERAATCYLRASEQALERNDLDGGLAYIARGVASGVAGEVLGGVRCVQSQVHFWRGELTRAHEVGIEALALLPSMSPRWYKTIGFLSAVTADFGQAGNLKALGQQFAEMTPDTTPPTSYAQAVAQLVNGLAVFGERREAARLLERAAQASGSAADPEVRAWLAYGRSIYLYTLEPDPWSALLFIEEAATEFGQASDWRNFGLVQVTMGAAQRSLGLYEDAEMTLRGILDMAAHLREPLLSTYARLHLALVLSERGDPTQLEEACLLGSQIISGSEPAAYYAGFAHLILAQRLASNESWQEAESAARQALQILRATPAYAPSAFAALLKILLLRGKIQDAHATCEEAARLLSALGSAGQAEIGLRLAIAAVHHAVSDIPAFQISIQEAARQVHVRANLISDPAVREAFLTCVAENAKAIELASAELRKPTPERSLLK